MHVALSLLARELFLLICLAAIGVGPATWISSRVDRPARIALLPALGLAVALCVMTTVTWRFSTNDSFWLLGVLAVASVAVGALRSRRSKAGQPGPGWRGERRALTQLLLVVVVIGGAYNAPLIERQSVGPVGYDVSDAADYVSYQDGLRTASTHAAAQANAIAVTHRPDLIQLNWGQHAVGIQQVGFDAVGSSVNAMLGLGASQTYSAFMITVLVITALGLYAAVRVVAGERPWAAVLAGILVAGPFWIQLFMVGSEAAQVGLSLLTPLFTMVCLALRRPRRSHWVLVAVLAAGLQTAYPLFVPPLAVGGAIFGLGLVALRRHQRALTRAELRRVLLTLAGVIVLSGALTPYAFARNVHYWLGVTGGSLNNVYGGLPQYALPPILIPSWLLQTRWLYHLPPTFPVSVLPGSILGPLAMLATIAYAVRRRLILLVALSLVGGGAVLGYYAWEKYHCSYCVDRNLLLASPLGTVAFAIGVALLLAASRRELRLAAYAVTAIALVGIGVQVRVGQLYLGNAAYAFDPQTRAVISRLPAHPAAGAIAMEGFGQTDRAPLEDSVVYAAVRSATGVPPSMPTETQDYSGLAYLGGPSPVGAAFDPAYRYVLTRLGGVQTGRPIIFAAGPVALERRLPFDILVTGGVQAAPVGADPRGRAWIQPQTPLTMWISGAHAGQPVAVNLELRATVPVVVQRVAGSVVTREGSRLHVCVPVAGAGAFRRLELHVQFTAIPQPAPSAQPFSSPPPPEGVQLMGTRAAKGGCAG